MTELLIKHEDSYHTVCEDCVKEILRLYELGKIN